ncbi:xylan 1,4-beta-xylosidase [Parabacteroides sp. PFB2-12]|uniref:glycoside hydrolase family 43 protein n=1 Tax=unclassified Parabacteroides TaxID=2649774 RepID=UPI002475B4E3|nr:MULTISPECIES: glycoside hydrolase family 43 protein [unclassified Parabacteroides]MDH6344154.1 xylan 1,4-beta-xylosidase [Parabacteroides sp. PM6-13]MDH6392021.1 xylan 1,4-beta-xylosidase [Parabacteroides sp. PFB2-12]
MKRIVIKPWFALWLSACTIGLSTASCNPTKEHKEMPAVGKSVALFDHFSYIGQDDIYTSNPLPEENCFYNPVLPGWYSDPSVCANDQGDYFLVTSSFSYFPGVPLFHSRDLVNWKQVGHVLSRPSQLVNLAGQGISGGIFAPAIEYNPHNKTYYMVTTNVGAGNFFVKTQDPFGEWSDPIMLPSIQGIDPSFFFDEDGKAYIVNNDDAPNYKPEYSGHRTIRIQEFDVESDQTIGPRKILVDKGARPEEKPIWIEGPHLYKIDGRYFLMSAEGGTGGWHSEVIFRGDSPMGSFIPWENNPILTQRALSADRPNPITCAGHADLIQTQEGDWWAFFLACRPINNKFENLGRETFAMPVKWHKEGFPYITQEKDVIPVIVKREGVKRDSTVTFGNFAVYDTFDENTLDMSWMTLRGPATDLYSLTETPGYLTLKCSPVSATEKGTPAFICRRMQHHKFECNTRLLFSPSDEKEKAGLLLFKDEAHQYFLFTGMEGTERYVSLQRIEKDGNKTLIKHNIKNDATVIDFKVVSKGTVYDFYYAMGDNKWDLLSKNIDAGYLSTATAGGFTGTTIGMYATR